MNGASCCVAQRTPCRGPIELGQTEAQSQGRALPAPLVEVPRPSGLVESYLGLILGLLLLVTDWGRVADLWRAADVDPARFDMAAKAARVVARVVLEHAAT